MIQWNFNNKDNNTFGKDINHFWGSLWYLLISMPLGIIYFTFAVTGISLGLGTSIIYIGVPIAAITLMCAKKIVYIKIINNLAETSAKFTLKF